MADNDNNTPVIATDTAIEQVLKTPVAVVAPTLGVIVEVLEQIVGDLSQPLIGDLAAPK